MIFFVSGKKFSPNYNPGNREGKVLLRAKNGGGHTEDRKTLKGAGDIFGFLPMRPTSDTIGNTLDYCRNEGHDL